ncbi:MAG: hypothetical protein CM15mV25_1560 [uncultured marine virus]|nr:MAG: hypothetical protein CM15mV25_1560 [uncultured marine virus]
MSEDVLDIQVTIGETKITLRLWVENGMMKVMIKFTLPIYDFEDEEVTIQIGKSYVNNKMYRKGMSNNVSEEKSTI